MSVKITDAKFGRLYQESYKKAIVLEIEREGISVAFSCARHGLSTAVVYSWIKKHGSSEYLSSRQKKRSLAEKNKIIREILSGRSTISEAQLKYNIDCRDTITWWIREYNKDKQELFADFGEAPGIPVQEPGLTEMQKELEMARLKIRALEVMVDIASDQFKVDIRKKFGAKQ